MFVYNSKVSTEQASDIVVPSLNNAYASGAYFSATQKTRTVQETAATGTLSHGACGLRGVNAQQMNAVPIELVGDAGQGSHQ